MEVHILEETTEKSSSGSSQPIDWKKYQYALLEGKLYLEQVTLDSSDKTGICNIVQVCDRETGLILVSCHVQQKSIILLIIQAMNLILKKSSQSKTHMNSSKIWLLI